MRRTVLHFLDDIRDATDKILDFRKGVTFEDFSTDEMRKDAIVWNFEVIGEAVKNLPDELKGRYPSIEWRKIAGLRDAIVHGYFRIDYEVLWEIIDRDLPALQKHIKTIIADQEKREAE